MPRFCAKSATVAAKKTAKKFFKKKKVKFVLTCATEFGTICKSAIGRILPYLRDIAMNREIAQVSEVTFGGVCPNIGRLREYLYVA